MLVALRMVNVRQLYATNVTYDPATHGHKHLEREKSARSPYTFLYVNTGEHQVFVDMGAGRWVPNAGKLVRSMNESGIDPEQIDTVVITHAHPDHIGGTLDGEDNHIFAKASYYISKEERDFWFSEGSLDQTPKWFVRLAQEGQPCMWITIGSS
jgi:glyoxylase-like metal-dependent hydrolase (beta-lactamase superfamily II)